MYMVANILMSLVNIYTTLIFIYVVMSWIPNSGTGVFSQIYSAFGVICDPYLNIFRRLIPPIGGFLDVTPIIALLVLQLGVKFVIRLMMF